ncbi:cytochrome c oxidase subunit II [bacterium (Candidatus Blackallbacteria) CG17_big_fil_post_rev_8_21_14_2_50_48_46]|uniref:cytochrome-c oxidase n=1 Tax=bacterium (Candidatus Blackallbacteria) CG17_big_fil_post_rev_8_21_14_2_50_48_46 TaxID=2014261 RepID=A0A2M7GB43_9BACT|nr:MAG: cytochrome c oxidase subunit II [bacterium (Candidatus Blackallbacteria) CG18_big_fil_WC_8_21_14_2_50_49_26]PIW19409.1 MAG: cytochrome c oxidase subunit II [bacterium (Candidatus Blackallbacteria) CG17_big_fil_post_rev_8_21_14_2_50_48_46]PIW48987.1 MAG: cytochrome c oxidase subunit II [bacterium (Candidatus Blackallbacteria) CG13_big_fil_rev_8_21_14_2_50_49_14]
MKAQSTSILRLILMMGSFLLMYPLNALALMDAQSTFDVKGTIGQEQLTVFWFTVGVSAFLLLTVGGVFFYALFRFRAKPGQDFAVPEQTHGSAKVEIALIIASCLLLLVIAVPNAKALFVMDKPPEDKPAMKVIAIGHQWWWEFQYPDLGITTANELHIPTNTAVKVDIKAVDVIHSFWVPRLAGKMDAVPGQINQMWLDAKEPGKYNGQCTEFCGDSHAQMRFLVFAHDKADFDKWTKSEKADAAKPDTVAQVNGEKVFMQGCNSCHAIKGTNAMGIIGPNLTHFGSRTSLGAVMYENNTDNLKNWIKFPQQMKPGNLMKLEQANIVLSDRDLADLVAYLQNLK